MKGREDPIIAERVGTTLVLTLNRPGKRNALGKEEASALVTAVGSVEAGIRSIIVTGAPPAFCAGGDFRYLSRVIELGALAASDSVYGNFHALTRALLNTRVPVIAAVNGPALGAGFDLALACDFRIAAQGATFASSWVKLGLVNGMAGAWLLARAIGGARAAEILLLGEAISSEHAKTMGLVNAVVDEHELMNAALALADKIALLPPEGVRATRASLRRALDIGLESEFAILAPVQGSLLTSDDFRRNAAKFLDSRRK